MLPFRATHLPEPDLVFGNHNEEQDPRIGLRQFGPFFTTSEEEPSPSQVRVGIIGTGETITLARDVLRQLESRIPTSDSNHWLYPDFDGFSSSAPIRCKLISADHWNAVLLPQEIKRIIEIIEPQERIAACANLLAEKLGKIGGEDDRPHVVIVALPKILEDYCGISERTRGAKKSKLTTAEKAVAKMNRQSNKGRGHQGFLETWGIAMNEADDTPSRSYDLRNALKGKVMPHGIPIQILRESRGRAFLLRLAEPQGDSPVPEAASFAWDFAMGLYYKANGKPWRLAKLTEGTCYVGIHFFQYLRSPNRDMQTSMAQVFTHSGDGFVLRGTDVVIERGSKEAHLTEDQARALLDDVVKKYTEKAGPPKRIVIHKTSRFSEAERSGFLDVVQEIPYDFVTVSYRNPARFYRLGEFPVLRGTMISLGDSQYLLYTGGFTPRVRTYPGRRVPQPLLLIHEGCSEIKLIASEILGLTKLNWNTTQFSTNFPITLEFAEKVARVLSELEPGAPLQDHYRFYM